MCEICEKSVRANREGLIDLGIPAPKYPNSYLMQCPHCGAYWMGHGFTPQFMLELNAAEAKETFPGLQGAGAAT
jgi:hypothetical protein